MPPGIERRLAPLRELFMADSEHRLELLLIDTRQIFLQGRIIEVRLIVGRSERAFVPLASEKREDRAILVTERGPDPELLIRVDESVGRPHVDAVEHLLQGSERELLPASFGPWIRCRPSWPSDRSSTTSVNGPKARRSSWRIFNFGSPCS